MQTFIFDACTPFGNTQIHIEVDDNDTMYSALGRALKAFGDTVIFDQKSGKPLIEVRESS
jgi:uncharacterized protein YxjI